MEMEKERVIKKERGQLTFKLFELEDGELYYLVNGKYYPFREFEKAIELSLEAMTPVSNNE